MALNCAQCGKELALNPDGRVPAWCPKCGADFKPQPAAPAPAVAAANSLQASASAPTAVLDPVRTPARAPAPVPAEGPKVFGMAVMPTKQQMPLVVALGALVIFGPFLHKAYHGMTSLEEFDQQITNWTKEPVPAAGEPYIRGKVLPILRSYKTTQVRGKYPAVDAALYWEMPRGLRAGSPDEVGTVLLLDWTETTRTAPGPNPFTVRLTACLETCQVTLVDARRGLQLAVKNFKSTDPDNPPPGRRGRKYVYGDPPYAEIVAYLQSLPRKDP